MSAWAFSGQNKNDQMPIALSGELLPYWITVLFSRYRIPPPAPVMGTDYIIPCTSRDPPAWSSTGHSENASRINSRNKMAGQQGAANLSEFCNFAIFVSSVMVTPDTHRKGPLSLV